MDVNVLRSAIRQFGKVESSEIVALTGGEPFIYPDRLSTALEEIQQISHLKSGVITNAFWATATKNAKETLESLSLINQVCISTDIYHKEFVPLSFIKNALLACEDLGIPTFLAVCIDQSGTYQAELRHALGEDLYRRTPQWLTYVQKMGRAATLNVEYEGLCDNVLWDSCYIAGSPLVFYDGTVVTCCNCTRLRVTPSQSMSRLHGSPLKIGHLSKNTLQEMFLTMNTDMVLQALRTLGVRGIFNRLSEARTYPPGISSDSHPCDLCIALMTDPHTVNRLREVFTSEAYAEEIRLKRAYYYGESM